MVPPKSTSISLVSFFSSAILILGNDNNLKNMLENKQTLFDWQHLYVRAWQGDCSLHVPF